MKKYFSFGELLTDYRTYAGLSQLELAARLNVDVRSVIRWEKDETMVKSEKEKELVEATFIPYQVIRNLNAAVPIPTYFDFRIRKYSTAELFNEMPSAERLLSEMEHKTTRLRKTNIEKDIDKIMHYDEMHSQMYKPVNKYLIIEAIKLLPELNLVIEDNAGFHCGHCVFFPLKVDTFEKLKNREIVEAQIKPDQLVDYKNQDIPVFHNFAITADCNENAFYLIGAIFRFFKSQKPKDFIYSAITTRHDSFEVNKDMGIDIIWEDKEEQERLGLEFPPRFYTGRPVNFFKSV